MSKTSVSLDEQIRCVARELRLRQDCYPRWVAQKRFSQEHADREIARMEAVLDTLTRLKAREETPLFGGME